MSDFSGTVFNVGVRHAINPLEFYWYNWLHFPYTVIDTWLGANTDVYYEVFNRVVPLLVAIPYAASYYTDKRSGIINNYYVRTKRINYLVAKLAAVFLTGGAIVVFPLLLTLYLHRLSFQPFYGRHHRLK